MAVYHLSAKIIGRKTGRSAVASAAYRAGEKLHDLKSGRAHDYANRRFVEHKEVMAPDGAPEWARQREALWNRVEAAEKRKDSQLAREIEVSLPRELSHSARVQLVRDFVQEHFVSKGMIADIAIHNPPASDGLGNPHAHVMLTMRNLDEWEFGGKNRQWNRDFTDGGKSVDDRVGGFANVHGPGNGFVGTNTGGLKGLRASWASAVNEALEENGSNERVDHRSYQARGVNREAQPKLGAAHWVHDRTGAMRDQMREFMAVKERNAMRHSLERISSGAALGEAERISRAMQADAAMTAARMQGTGRRSFDYGEVER